MSVREELNAAFAEVSGDEPAETAAPVVAQDTATPADGAQTAPLSTGETQDNATAGEGAKTRDAAGKFAKASEGAAETTETAKLADQEPLTPETIRVPPSLPAAIKAKFKDLDPDVREAFVNLEGSVQTAKAEWTRKGERLNRFDELFSPRIEKIRLSGLDEFSAVQTLFAAQDLLERNPVEGLQYLARSYGVDLARLPQQTSGQGQALPALDPALQTLSQQVQALQQQFGQTQQATEAAHVATAATEIETFRSDPKNIYFDNVRDQMVALLKAGQADSLPAAYEAAIWMHPEIRPLLLKEQAAASQRTTAEQAERERSAAAKRAAGSVTGGPGTAASPQAGASAGSVRNDLQAAWETHAA